MTLIESQLRSKITDILTWCAPEIQVERIMELLTSTPMLVREFGSGIFEVVESDYTDSSDECEGYMVWTTQN